MKGSKRVIVSNRFAKFDFTLYRNITIIRGDSGTGKSTLFNMIADYSRNAEHSGVNLATPCPCVALVDSNWQIQLRNTKGSIVFVDEDFNNKYLNTKEFAEEVQNSDNYYVLFTREDLHNLPYSVEEIYEIRTSGKYHSLKKLYPGKAGVGYYYNQKSKSTVDGILTEDAKAGFQFFQAVFEEIGKPCSSAGANSNIYKRIMEDKEKKLLVIADGAAFGAEIDRVLKLEKSGYKICLYLPESFEWIILKSGLIQEVSKILDSPSEYIESGTYFSWERFFTALLVEKTQDSYLSYRKASLNENYLHKAEKSAIIRVMPGFDK